jgi:cytochrome P450
MTQSLTTTCRKRFDPYMPEPVITLAELLADPDATLKRAREAGVMVETEMGPLVVRHEAVRELGQSDKLRPAFSRVLQQFGVTSGPFYDWMSVSPLDMEGDEHRVWRQLMAKTFTPRSVERLRPFLRAEAERLVDGILPLGRCDFIEAFARKLPAAGLCELIGVPVADRERFAGWADTIGFGFNIVMLPLKIKEVDAALTALLAYSDELVVSRRAAPKDDLVTRIAQAVDEDAGIDEAVIRASVAGLVFAGHETTKNQLGWMVAVLSEVASEWDRVAAEPERARDVIEEVLRFRSTATSFGRLALEDVEIGGSRIAAGTSVIASIWSANRDASEFPKPDVIAVDENRNGVQVAFGQGAHHCLGAALARAELQESLIALTRRMHCPKLEHGAEFLPPIGINGPTKLPIAFERR